MVKQASHRHVTGKYTNLQNTKRSNKSNANKKWRCHHPMRMDALRDIAYIRIAK